MMTELVLQTPEVFKRLDQPSRYKGAYGGRGSGKSWHFASMVVDEDGYPKLPACLDRRGKPAPLADAALTTKSPVVSRA